MKKDFKNFISNLGMLNKMLIIIIFLLILSSVILKIFTIKNQSAINESELELQLMQKNLSKIEKFDKLFPRKWTHYFYQDPNLILLRDDLKELGFFDIKIDEYQKDYVFEGQVSNIKDITSIINFYYNTRGMVIKKLNIDQVAENIIVFNFSLTY